MSSPDLTRIWDTFQFCGELDMLECRLRTTAAYVHKWVILESTQTHQGQPRAPSVLSGPRWDPWADGIIQVVARPRGCDPWTREEAQRDAATADILAATAPLDLILHSDVDEIPDLARIHDRQPPFALTMTQFVFAADWLSREHEPFTVCEYAGDLKSLSLLRARRGVLPRVHAGAHLSWFGGPAAIEEKAARCGHAATVAPQVKAAQGTMWEDGFVPWDGIYLRHTTHHPDWPQWVMDHRCPDVWWSPRA